MNRTSIAALAATFLVFARAAWAQQGSAPSGTPDSVAQANENSASPPAAQAPKTLDNGSRMARNSNPADDAQQGPAAPSSTEAQSNQATNQAADNATAGKASAGKEHSTDAGTVE